MRRGDHVGEADERRILRRFLRESIHGGAGNLARAQSFGERGFVHKFAARAIDEAHAALHLRDGSGVDHFFGAGAERGVQRNVIAAGEKIGERNKLDFEFLGDLLADVGIVGQHGHFERLRSARDFGAHAAEADEAERFAAHFGSHRARFFPAAGVNGGVELRHGARERKQQRESVFGDADGVAAGRIHHQHAAARGGFDVHVIYADAGAADNFQIGGFFE